MTTYFKSRALAFILLTFQLLILSSCTKDNLKKFNRLESLRVLAFSTTTPEVNPGDTVTLSPIISDIHGTTLSYSVTTCLDAGIAYGAEPTCKNHPEKQVIANKVSLTLPGVSNQWTGLADSFSVVVPPSEIVFANKSAIEKYNGVAYLVEYILENKLGESVKAIKRILVSDSVTKTQKNQNPVVTEILSNAVALNSLVYGSKSNLTTNLDLAISAESYSIQTETGLQSQNEKLTTTWFVTDGEMKYFRTSGTDSNEWTTPAEIPSGRSVFLIAIARDDRGGLVSVIKKF
jgi:hypothetical protein